MTIYEKLSAVQQELKAPKDLYNKFGQYPYRSAEGILEAVKPLLAKYGLALYLTDDMVEIGGRVYVKATAGLVDIGKDPVPSAFSVSAYAREEETKKGMDASQVTGAASSYARKYALNGLFCIDDNKDSDFTNTTPREDPPKKPAPQKKPDLESVRAPETFTPLCKDCGKQLTDAEHDWSVRWYGVPLCREHQKAHQKIK